VAKSKEVTDQGLDKRLDRPQAPLARSARLNPQFIFGLIALNVFTYLIAVAVAFTLAGLLAWLLVDIFPLLQ
jgi:hypothetical protein